MQKTISTKRVGRLYKDQQLAQIAMPMGGLGSGCICLNGIGGLHDFSIRNRPATTAVPDNHGVSDAAFALVRIKGAKPVTLLVEGQLPRSWIYDRGLQSQGYRKGGQDGLPRFRHSTFRSEYPFGHVHLTDPDVPIDITLTGWSPLVPLDERASSFPCAILDYTIKNTSRRAVSFEFSYHVSHWAPSAAGTDTTRTTVIPNGVSLYNCDPAEAETFGSAALSVIGHKPTIKASWFRGGWFDAISVLWRECASGRFEPTGATTTDRPGRNGASILVKVRLEPGESVTIPIILTWHFPNVHYGAGQSQSVVQLGRGNVPLWKPWYTTQWADAAAVAADIHANYESLRRRTAAFKDALYSSTMPAAALDAVAANLAILKSPTILRQANGNVWAWEGCFTGIGCCHGSCTHVWNYAQALPHLFPSLERTLREQELERSMDDIGHVTFRAALPDGPVDHAFHAAADGQLGGILKLWRDWHISGDHEWLARLYPLAKRSLSFSVDHWDPQRKGLLSEPHHNTYDIEFWGPDGMCTSIYLNALVAMADLADACGDRTFAVDCRALARRGSAAAEKLLFNGSYYAQKVQWTQLKDRTVADRIAAGDPSDPEIALLSKEGPKYQYAGGCLADGIIGAWMAELYGIPSPLNSRHILTHLQSVFKHNFKSSLLRHANCQRSGYAVGDEPGLLLCTWPKGKAPTLPFPYADEVWTGVEYQVASHLLLHGQRAAAVKIIDAVRSRYDGITRNPFNEYECGSYYARAMSSYSLLQAFSGIRYSAVDRTLHVRPDKASPIQSFLSTATGYGAVRVDSRFLTITLLEGSLAISTIKLTRGTKVSTLAVNSTASAAKVLKLSLQSEPRRARRSAKSTRG
ncbi:MAG: hypothetical protein JWM57_2783 [Phycisphaerales bacterium]|nr:hypothetical protein [Phycisphaerales bacterium]